jgi:superfamily I DNA and/or RNA helicase
MERLLLGHPFYDKTYGVNNDEYDPNFVTKLKINYRALPSLLKVYNDLFYNGELESRVDENLSVEASMMSNADSFLWKHTNKKCSVFFVNVNNGKNRKIQDSCSWYNEEEIRAIMSFLHKCSSAQVPFKDIGIVTPYSLQVKKLKHQIAVGTSVSFSNKIISINFIFIFKTFTGN